MINEKRKKGRKEGRKCEGGGEPTRMDARERETKL